MPVPSYGRSPREQTKRESRKNLKGLVRDHLHTCIGLSTCGGDEDVSKFDVKIDPSFDDCGNGDFRATGEGRCIESRSDWSLNVGDCKIQFSAASKRRQSRILDRWAARQAEEMITTIERQAYEAELQALTSAHPVSMRDSSFMRETSPARSECSVELPNLRASSLVQMWRELEAEATMTMENRTSSMNSAWSGMTNAASPGDNGSSNEQSESCDSADERYSPVAPDDSFMDWESDATAHQPSDAGESERGRVSSMIRRLNSSGRRASNSLTSCGDQTEREQPSASGISGTSSNGTRRLIRGRQANRDLLMRVEHDRKKELARVAERHAVSFFSHRCRLQALLRFRLLQRDVAIHEQPNHTSSPTACELDQLQQRSSISLLRERFSPRSKQDSCSSSTQLPVSSVDSEHSVLTEQLSNENIVDQEISTRDPDQEGTQLTQHLSPISRDLPEDTRSSHFVLKERRLSTLDLDLQAGMPTSLHNSLERDTVTEEIESNIRPRQHVETESTDLTQSSGESCPQRTRHDGLNEAMHQEERASQSSNLAWNRRRLSSDDIDWHGTANAAATELDPNNQLQVEVGHRDGAQSTDFPHPQSTRDGHSEAICDNWLASISNEELHAVTMRPPVPDTQRHEEVRQTDATWSNDESLTQSRGDIEDDAMHQDWLEYNSDNEEGDAVTELHHNVQQDIGVRYMQRTRSSRDEALYQDWLERISDNEEMLALLARRSVSITLASDFRVRMDRLMSSHMQIQENGIFMDDSVAEEQIPPGLYDHEAQNENRTASPSTQLPLPSEFSDQQNPPFMYQEAQNFPPLHNDETTDVNEVTLSSIQLPLPLQLRFLNHEGSQNFPLLSYDSEANNVNQVASTSFIQLPSPSQSLDRQSSPQQNSSIPSLEMELISDLREDMLRLHRDMCELRRSIESCINMQAQLQRSIKQEVSAASGHSGESSEKPNSSSTYVSMRKGSCCICYEMQIDSLLYRCGHMCTCYKCAYELQWSSGICPICRAPIVDVVRAYSDT